MNYSVLGQKYKIVIEGKYTEENLFEHLSKVLHDAIVTVSDSNNDKHSIANGHDRVKYYNTITRLQINEHLEKINHIIKNSGFPDKLWKELDNYNFIKLCLIFELITNSKEMIEMSLFMIEVPIIDQLVKEVGYCSFLIFFDFNLQIKSELLKS